MFKMEITEQGQIKRLFGYGDLTASVRSVIPPVIGEPDRCYTIRVPEEQVELFISEDGD